MNILDLITEIEAGCSRQSFSPIDVHLLCKSLRVAIRERDALRVALSEIAKGEGKFSMDPLTHASNTIDNMVKIAEDALLCATEIEQILKGEQE